MGADTTVPALMWKAQVPWLAQRHAVVTFDPVGNGRNTRSLDPAGVDQAVVAGVCTGDGLTLQLAAEQPDRVLGVVAINPGLLLSPMHEHRGWPTFDDVHVDDDGWHKENVHYWRRDWPGYAAFFFGAMLPEPHSTKQHEDAVAWACSTTAEVMLADHACTAETRRAPEESAIDICRRVRCPMLVINGDHDMGQPPERSHRVSELTSGDLVVIAGAGHLPPCRDPVRVNLEIDAFLRRCHLRATAPLPRPRVTCRRTT